jgi:predicted transcriptional regulator
MDNEIHPYDDAVARVLDGRRVERRLEVRDLATISGIPWRTLYRYLQGERPIPMSRFYEICSAMGVEMSDVADAALKIVETAQQESRG